MSRKAEVAKFLEDLGDLVADHPAKEDAIAQASLLGGILIEIANIGDMLELVAQEISRTE